MPLPDDFASFTVEIISSIFVGVTGRNEKGLPVMYLALIFFIPWWFLYLLIILLIVSGSFNDLDESGHLSNPRDDVMD